MICQVYWEVRPDQMVVDCFVAVFLGAKDDDDAQPTLLIHGNTETPFSGPSFLSHLIPIGLVRRGPTWIAAQ
jgi:hypothetical protein